MFLVYFWPNSGRFIKQKDPAEREIPCVHFRVSPFVLLPYLTASISTYVLIQEVICTKRIGQGGDVTRWCPGVPRGASWRPSSPRTPGAKRRAPRSFLATKFASNARSQTPCPAELAPVPRHFECARHQTNVRCLVQSQLIEPITKQRVEHVTQENSP